ncbi:MAG TPA: RES domain-containing protein [Actinomycetota bacterium]|nr:RES domain-containing protein [Actinomycetota bacterium]
MPRYSRLYRVFPWIETAGPGEPGHPVYVASPQGHGRVDNPEHYLTLYASDHWEGAVGEAFGNHAVWTRDLLQGPPALPGSRRALAEFDAAGVDIVDLDDPAVLLEWRLRPSEVVTRVRSVTQAWALQIFGEARWAGVRWWSYHDPAWGSFGLWDASDLRVAEVRPLSDDVDRVREVAARMSRVWED